MTKLVHRRGGLTCCGSRSVRLHDGGAEAWPSYSHRKLRASILNPKQRGHWPWYRFLDSQSPDPVMCILQQGCVSYTSLNSTSNWGANILIPEPLDAILI